jgi:hypothetical protein
MTSRQVSPPAQRLNPRTSLRWALLGVAALQAVGLSVTLAGLSALRPLAFTMACLERQGLLPSIFEVSLSISENLPALMLCLLAGGNVVPILGIVVLVRRRAVANVVLFQAVFTLSQAILLLLAWTSIVSDLVRIHHSVHCL